MTEAVERLATACELPAAQIPPRMTYRTGSSNGSAEIWGPEETTEGWTGQTLAQAILAADPALAAAIELGLRLANRITPEALASVYATDALFVARLCDEYLDRSGGLLGRVRLAARLREPKP